MSYTLDPKIDDYYRCYSRGAVLRCCTLPEYWHSEREFEFEYITISDSEQARFRGDYVGKREWISIRHLKPLHLLNAMEVLAHAAR